MKQSIYNHFVPIGGDKVICYNAFADAFLVTTENYVENIENPDMDSKIYKQFVDNGFIIEDEFDEKKAFLAERAAAIHNKDTYQLIINPTMDCNLRCWYCYETHQEGSCLSEDLICAIEKHIELKFKSIKFRELILIFFGGEPLLRIDIVERLIKTTKTLSEKYDFALHVSFTTNGTLMTDELLVTLKTENTSFQITLDGNEECHNKVRKLKQTGGATYSTIVNTVERILTVLNDKTEIVLRVNMSAATVKDMEQILADIDKFSVYHNFSVGLHRVWQVQSDKIDEAKVLRFVSKCQSLGIKCNYLNLQKCFCSCYADYENEVVINYDGLVYKCTAREFKKENSCGHLDLDGKIIWDTALMNKRLSLALPTQCEDCNLLPSCPKYCSQKMMENATQCCLIGEGYSVSDYIVHNFNNYLIDYKKTLNK
ncbi:MAG: radical SAM protein [Bacteroidales bacterium]|nr:radical SAM protein [Bacteroidales bacterium]